MGKQSRSITSMNRETPVGTERRCNLRGSGGNLRLPHRQSL